MSFSESDGVDTSYITQDIPNIHLTVHLDSSCQAAEYYSKLFCVCVCVFVNAVLWKIQV